ncbi:hypothetical protein Tco_0699819 [Tanacetum coccineum]
MATMAKNVLAAGKENEEMLLDSIHNGPFQFKEITILVTETTTAITRMQKLSDLTPEEKSRLIMEYLVKLSKRRAFWSLNEDILKIMATNYQYVVSIKEDMAYPCLHSPKTTKEIRSLRRIQKRSIRRIEDIVCEATRRYQVWSLLQETQYVVTMDDPNITMEEYMRLKEEKAHRCGKVYNWETAKYGKIWYDEDVHHLRSVETEFLAIVFDDAFTSKVTHSHIKAIKEEKNKRYKSSSSSSFNTSQSEVGSFYLNTQAVDDKEEDVQEVQRPMGIEMTNNKAAASSKSSACGNEDALAKLMVNEYADLTQPYKERKSKCVESFLDIRRGSWN